MVVIPALGRLRQEDWEIKTSEIICLKKKDT
jgi:hypothetical protein